MAEEIVHSLAEREPEVPSGPESQGKTCPAPRNGTRLMMFTDQPLLAHGVHCLLSDEIGAGIAVVAGPVDSMESAVRAHQPDVLLVDLTPEVSVAVLSRIRSARPETRIIVMASALSWEMAYQLKAIGILGMLKRNCTLEDCVAAFSQGAHAACRLSDPQNDAPEVGEIVHLSRREGQLVTLLSQGLKNKEMAQCLGISEGTIRVYLSKLYLKIGVNDRFELALFGLRNSSNLPAIGLDPMDGDPAAARRIPALRSLWLRRARTRLVAGVTAAAGRSDL